MLYEVVTLQVSPGGMSCPTFVCSFCRHRLQLDGWVGVPGSGAGALQVNGFGWHGRGGSVGCSGACIWAEGFSEEPTHGALHQAVPADSQVRLGGVAPITVVSRMQTAGDRLCVV